MNKTPGKFTSVAVLLGIAIALLWLFALFEDLPEGRRLASSGVCFVPLVPSDQLTESVCVSADARTPPVPNVVPVILSRDHLARFMKSIRAKDLAARGVEEPALYQIRKSNGERDWSLNKTQMRYVLTQLVELLDSQYAGTERPALEAILQRLA
jgi:hypothetical protein